MATAMATEVNKSPTGIFDGLKRELEHLNTDIDTGTLEEDFQEFATVQARGRQSFRFLEEDDDFQRVLAEGGANPSLRVDRWALNRLNSFREFKKLDRSIPFYEMHSVEIVKLLCKFFEQVCKLDGSLYPSQSLMSLYRAFHRMIRQNQERRILETGVSEPILSLKENPIFKAVGIACVLAMSRSRGAGANFPRKKSSVISIADEATILSHPFMSVTHPRGLQKRVAFYLLSRFCIRGGAELYGLHIGDFELGTDEVNRYVRYDERLSKNYKVSLDRYQEEHFRPSIKEYDPDVILSMELLQRHLPTSVPESERFLFYQAIDNPRTLAWYSTSRVALRNLSKWLNLIHIECGLVADGVTNKSGRTTCVTRMAAEGVPAAVGMLITGHKSAGAYARYDRSTEAKVRAAQKCVAEGTSFTNNAKVEGEILQGRMIIGNVDSPTVTAVSTLDSESATNVLGTATGEKNIVGAPEIEIEKLLSVQTTEDYDRWANMVNWESIDKDLAATGVFVGSTITTNPITAVFGKIHCMSNCNVTINLGGNGGPSTGGIANILGSI